MFGVFMFVPVFDSCDRYFGSKAFPVGGLPVYETAGMAVRKAAEMNAAEGDEAIYFKAIDVETYRPAADRLAPAAPEFDDGSDDIEF